MLQTLESAFSVAFMAGLTEDFYKELGINFAFSRFRAGGVEPLDPGQTSLVWDESMASRAMAPPIGPDSPPVRSPRNSRKAREFRCLNFELEDFIPASSLFRERGLGKLAASAEGTVARSVKSLMGRIQRTLEYVSVGLLQGPVDISSASIAGSQIPVTTYGENVTTNTYDDPWNQAATKIVSHELVGLQKAYVAANGQAPGLALISPEIEGYLMANDEVRSWGRQLYGDAVLLNNAASEEVLRGLRLGGFLWSKSIGGHKPDGGAFTQFMPSDKVLILPDALSETLGVIEGYGVIPKAAYGSGEGVNEMLSVAPSRGFYSYTKDGGEEGKGLKVVVGYAGGPFVKDPTRILCQTIK